MTRIHTLDIVRGLSMFFICGGDWIIHCLCKCFPNADFAQALHRQFTHVAWEGLTFYDILFPTFLLISGTAFTLSWHRQEEKGIPVRERWKKLALRTLLLILLGILYNGALEQTSLATVRFPSVLARIGLGVFLAAIPYTLLPCRWRWTFLPIGLIAYALLFTLCGGATPYAESNNWAGAIDIALLPGVNENGQHALDAEGLISTLSAPLTATIGMLLGDLLRSDIKRKTLWILLAGITLIGLAYASAPWVPVVKKLWTSSYVCLSGGWTLIIVAPIYLLADRLQYYRSFYPLTFIGIHALWFYLLGHFVNFPAIAWQFISGPISALTDDNAICSLAYAIAGFALLWGSIWFILHKRHP